MDNGAITMNSSRELIWPYEQLNSIFGPYRFELQQFNTNDTLLQSHLNCQEYPVVELFGIHWNTSLDILCSKKKYLDQTANTK